MIFRPEAQQNAAWLRERADQCFRLARAVAQPDVAEQLQRLGEEFEKRARMIEETDRAAKEEPAAS